MIFWITREQIGENMGCLESILRKILFIALLAAFFAFGGYTFTKQKISEYQNPTRDAFVEAEKNYGDFSKVPSDYQLTRSYNFFGYKKINAKYLPTGQKITIFDLKNEEMVSPRDFATKEIDTKVEGILDKTKDSLIALENFEIIKRGNYAPFGKFVPYIVYKAKVKNVPFKSIVGTIGAYSTLNKRAKKISTKLIYSSVDARAYNPTIVKNLIEAIKF